MIKWLKKLVKGSDFVVAKKKISVIALDPRAGKSYGEDIAGLFSDVADISVFSMLDGSAAGVLERADLFVASTDAYGSPEELAKHIPLDSQTMAIEVSFRWSELRKLKELPAGSKVLFVNMTETMAREAIAQLEQFGIYKNPDETVLETLQRVFSTDFMSHNDNAFLDLTIDKSLEINDGIGIEPNVYYFSYAGNQTVQDPVSGNYIPSARMWTLFYPGAYNMGKYYDKYTAGGIYIDRSWLPNDGLVNTVSALYPTTTDKNTTECRRQDGSQGWVNYDGYSDIAFRPGIWYVMPVTRADHMQFVGGIANKSIVQTHLFYLNLMDDIYSTYRAVQPGETPFPFTDVPESRWSYPYIRQLYDAGVVSGMSPSTFAPDDPITRAQLAVILYNYTKQFAPESLTETGSLAGFPDAGSVPSWARTAMAWAVGNGLISGVGENGVSYLRPEGCATRAQVATILMNYDKALG